MSIRLNGSTSGYTELDAGAVAGNNTLKMPTSNGAANQLLRNGATPGTLEFGGAIVSGTAQNSTSGTSIDFTGIPSWVKRVTVMFAGVSTNGTSSLQIQLGTSSGVENTGYSGSSTVHAVGSGYTVYTTGFGVFTNLATTTISGFVTVCLFGSNKWVAGGVTGYENGAAATLTGGQKTLSGTLDRVRITTVNGTDTFDAGTINIMWE